MKNFFSDDEIIKSINKIKSISEPSIYETQASLRLQIYNVRLIHISKELYGSYLNDAELAREEGLKAMRKRLTEIGIGDSKEIS